MLTVKRHTLVNALCTAIECYRNDAAVMLDGRVSASDRRLADQFTKQADECAKLANDIEEADQINLID